MPKVIALSSFLTILSFYLISVLNVEAGHRRVYQGIPARIIDFPYQIRLGANGYWICGGSILSQNYILTAAHCFSSYFGEIKKNEFSVKYGTSNLLWGGGLSRVEQVIIHPQYEHNNYMINDIAVLLLADPIPISNTAYPIQLRDVEAKPGEVATVSGWGTTESEQPTTNLLSVSVPVLDIDMCMDQWREPLSVRRGKICAWAKNRGGCLGDSGGPLVIGRSQVGIVSYGDRINTTKGNKCKFSDKPDIYTNVAVFKDFINTVTDNVAKWSST